RSASDQSGGRSAGIVSTTTVITTAFPSVGRRHVRYSPTRIPSVLSTLAYSGRRINGYTTSQTAAIPLVPHRMAADYRRRTRAGQNRARREAAPPTWGSRGRI